MPWNGIPIPTLLEPMQMCRVPAPEPDWHSLEVRTQATALTG